MKKNFNHKHLEKDLLTMLVVTGRSAEALVRKSVPANVAVKVLPIDVAAFITKQLILRHLPREEAIKYDLIMVPGLVTDDMTGASEKLGVPVVKGPRYASDIKNVIEEVDPFKLSSKIAADRFLSHKKYDESRKILATGFSRPLEEEQDEYSIGSLASFPVGINRPPLVMAEIVDATELSMEEVLWRAEYYLKYGAEIIDIGATTRSSEPEKIPKIVAAIRKEFQQKYPFAISIDTLDAEEIIAGIKAGVDLILSIDHGNVEFLLSEIPKDIGVVFIPTNIKKGFMPKTSQERVASLLKLRDRLLDEGLTKLAADPIIEMPIYPGFASSLDGYIEFRKRDKITPMMTCVGNVTEFLSADAIGINALFGCLAAELGIQFILVTDVSVKCRGGIKEIVRARDLSYVAKVKNAPPKGHGIHLLMAKSRTDNELEIHIPEALEILDLSEERNSKIPLEQFEKDPKGNITIWINYQLQRIFVAHLKEGTNEIDLLLSAGNGKLIFDELINRKLISRIDHAFYLGRELERAEICLYLGKTYVQDEQTFKDDF